MNRLLVVAMVLLAGAPLAESSALEKGTRFKYGLKPGDKWDAEEASQMLTDAMGMSITMRTKRVVRYEISMGPKKGWVTVTARIVSHTSQTGDEPADSKNLFEGMVFKVDMHTSGELRKYSFSGGDEKMTKYIGPAMENAIFRFPEFPEEPLRPGDDFDVKLQTQMSGMPGTEGIQTATKLTYTLEEVSGGLAHFSVVQRAQVKGAGMEVKDAGKGSAIFDMKAGMWVEHETKSKSQVESGVAGGATVLQVSKMKLEKR